MPPAPSSVKVYSRKIKVKAKGIVLALRNPKTALSTVVLTLSLLEKAAESIPVPGLKAVSGSLKLIVEVLQKLQQNHEDFAELDDCLRRLIQVLEPLLDTDRSDIPWALRDRIHRLAEDLQTILEEIESVTSHPAYRRVIDASEDAQKVVRCIRRITRSVDTFVMEGMIQTELSTVELLSKVNVLLLDMLPRSKTCAWDATGMDETSMCLTGTRKGAMSKIEDWLGRPQGGVFWLTGAAGCGKTTIARALAQRLAQAQRLGASFFCSRDQADRSDVNKVLPTITYQLAQFDIFFRHEIVALLTRNADVGHMHLPGQLQALVVQPLAKHRHREMFASVVVIIDALDECQDNDAAFRMLEMLSVSTHNLPLKFFITSRPERLIRIAFQLKSWRASQERLVVYQLDLAVWQGGLNRWVRGNRDDGIVVLDEHFGPKPDSGPNSAEGKHKSFSEESRKVAERIRAAGENAIAAVSTSLATAQLQLQLHAPSPELNKRVAKHGKDAIILADKSLKNPIVVTGISCFAKSRGISYSEGLLRLASMSLNKVLAAFPDDGEEVREFDAEGLARLDPAEARGAKELSGRPTAAKKGSGCVIC